MATINKAEARALAHLRDGWEIYHSRYEDPRGNCETFLCRGSEQKRMGSNVAKRLIAEGLVAATDEYCEAIYTLKG